MRSKTSLIRGLQYFDAVARHQSVKMAAVELNVSQSAVSHQMRELSATLGEDLIGRSGRGIALTAKGKQLANRLTAAFESLERSIEVIIGGGGQNVRLAVCTSFGPGWLAERLHTFYEANPAVDIELRLYTHQPEQTELIADAFVSAEPVSRGYESVRLFDEYLVSVHKSGSDTKRLSLITTAPDEAVLGKDWIDYADAAGLSEDVGKNHRIIRCTHYSMALELARVGQGFALVPDFLVRDELGRGVLTQCHPYRHPSGRTYRFCFKQSRADEPAIRALATWFRAQSEAA